MIALCMVYPMLLAQAPRVPSSAAPHVEAAMSVSLDTSESSPQPVGTLITWTAKVSNASAGTLMYRFRARRVGSNFHVVVDYGPKNTLDWTSSDTEGLYQVEASVENVTTGEVASTATSFLMQSLVKGGEPAINLTAHPMVFLYSAPACEPGSRMRVQFQSPDGFTQNTPYKRCQLGLSMNFYLAGLRGSTTYSVKHTIDTGSTFEQGPTLTLTTPPSRTDITSETVIQGPVPSSQQPILLQSTLFTNSYATDLNGNLLWFYPGSVSFLTRPARGGNFFGVIEDPVRNQAYQALREFDLTGMTVRETNAARVNQQLTAMGKRPISAFHHEARRLPDGKILVLAAVEQILTDVQGPGPVDVLGDMILIMDSNLQVVWTWDAFDHMDVTRKAILGEMCVSNSTGNCPPIFLAANANDWLHGNSVQQTPDGNLLYSARSQDWVIKIDYENGNGAGYVMWRLGPDGDFTIKSTDPNPWFSHQHDPQLLPDNTTMTLFDNANVRNLADPTVHSRGQVLQLDEKNLAANLILNADLGQYSFALGAAQKLANGNYHFDNGYLSDGGSLSLEVDESGHIVYAIHANISEYRSFRMQDLYTPPEP